MNNKRELKIAAVVGALMIIICLIIFISTQETKKTPSVQVYKNVELNGQRGYIPCEVPNSILLEISSEIQKAKQLTSANEVEMNRINGTYKIVLGNTSFAFDDSESKKIYSIENNKLYNFESTIYSLVITMCE